MRGHLNTGPQHFKKVVDLVDPHSAAPKEYASSVQFKTVVQTLPLTESLHHMTIFKNAKSIVLEVWLERMPDQLMLSISNHFLISIGEGGGSIFVKGEKLKWYAGIVPKAGWTRRIGIEYVELA